MASASNVASGGRKTLHLTVAGDSSAAKWCKPLEGQYVDRLQLRNKRRCFVRHDGAQVYWDDGRILSRGWWVETAGRTHYAFNGLDAEEVPTAGWSCPGMIGFYTSVDIRIEVRILVGRSIAKYEGECMTSLCHGLGQLCCGHGHGSAPPPTLHRPPKPSPSQDRRSSAGEPAAQAQARRRSESETLARPETRGSQADAAAGRPNGVQNHADNWPVVRRSISEGSEIAKTRGRQAAVHCHAAATDPETQQWVATHSGHAKNCCLSGLAAIVDGLIACMEGEKSQTPQHATRSVHPPAAPIHHDIEPTVTAVQAKGVLAVVTEATANDDGGEQFGMHVSRGISTSNDGSQKEQAFEEKRYTSLGGTPWGVGVVCRKGCRGETTDAPNGDAALALRVPGELSFYVVATGRGQQGHLNSEIAKDLLPALAARDSRFRSAGAVESLRAAFAGAASQCSAVSSDGPFAATMVVLDHAKNELTVAHSGNCAACVCHDVARGAAGPEGPEATPLAEAAMPSAHDAPAVKLAQPVRSGDRAIVLGSPGFWARVTPAAAAAFVRKFAPEDAQAAADSLFRDTQSRWEIQPAEDGVVPDITVVIAYTAREPRLS